MKKTLTRLSTYALLVSLLAQACAPANAPSVTADADAGPSQSFDCTNPDVWDTSDGQAACALPADGSGENDKVLPFLIISIAARVIVAAAARQALARAAASVAISAGRTVNLTSGAATQIATAGGISATLAAAHTLTSDDRFAILAAARRHADTRTCRCTFRNASQPSDCPDRVTATVSSGTSVGTCQANAKNTAPQHCRAYYGHCSWI